MADKPIAPMTNLDRLRFDLSVSSGGPVSVDYLTLHAMLKLLDWEWVAGRHVFDDDDKAKFWLSTIASENREPKP